MKIHSILPLKGNSACREKWHVTPVTYTYIEHPAQFRQLNLARATVYRPGIFKQILEDAATEIRCLFRIFQYELLPCLNF